jgi:two-component sensor histidine kinase
VGINDKHPARSPENHGSGYVAIFVRQIGGTIAVSKAEASGTIVRVRLPLLVASDLKR